MMLARQGAGLTLSDAARRDQEALLEEGPRSNGEVHLIFQLRLGVKPQLGQQQHLHQVRERAPLAGPAGPLARTAAVHCSDRALP